MKGQVIDIDFAIAAGLFITGLVTAFTLAFTLQQPESSGFPEELERSADSAITEFKDQSYWTATEQLYVENSGLNTDLKRPRIVRENREGNFTAKSEGGDILPVENFDNYTYLEVEHPSRYSIYRSERYLESKSFSDATVTSASGFQTSNITGDFNNDRIEDIEFEGRKAINYIEPPSGELSLEEKNGAVKIRFDETSFVASGYTPEVWLGSYQQELDISLDRSLETLKVIGGSDYDLTNTQTIQGEAPFLAHNGSHYLTFTGPSMSWTIQSSSSGPTDIQLEGEAYLSSKESESSAIRRALIDQNSSTVVSEEITGIKEEEARDTLGTGTRFKLGIPSSSSYNISFKDVSAGQKLPLSQNIVGRDYELNILKPNISFEKTEVKVRIWR